MIEDLTLKGCIEFAIATEEFGAENYSRLARKFGDIQDISQLFSRLSEDERVHKKQFSELLSGTGGSTANDKSPEMNDYLKGMSHSLFFSPYQGPFKDIDTIKDRDDALQKALEYEKATLGFYRAVEDVQGSNELLTKIIEAEKSHIIVIMKALLVKGSKFRSLQDQWT
ncbi:MAG: ferritin family protein [Acidobacteria bacterium]|nr:ferritin family protein [Acidobacteriota bacterium]